MTLNPIRSAQSLIPSADAELVDAVRRITPPWATFLRTLWTRTGGPQGPLFPFAVFSQMAPLAAQRWYLVTPVKAVVPANLDGTVAFAGTVATADAVFLLEWLTVAGATIGLGTITIPAGVAFGAVTATSQPAYLNPGDVLRLTAPLVADATLAEVAITIASRQT